MKFLSLISLLLFSGQAFSADPYIKLPETIAARPGRLLKITVDTNLENCEWLYFDDIDLIPMNKSAIFCSPKPGSFLIIVLGASNNTPMYAKCRVVVAPLAPITTTPVIRPASKSLPKPKKSNTDWYTPYRPRPLSIQNNAC